MYFRTDVTQVYPVEIRWNLSTQVIPRSSSSAFDLVMLWDYLDSDKFFEGFAIFDD